MLYTLKNISLIKTIQFNFRYFGFKNAMRIPVIISKNVSKMKLEGKVSLILGDESSIPYFGMIKIGFSNLGIVDKNREKILIENYGEIIFRGKASIGTGCRISNHGLLDIGNDFQASGKMVLIINKKMSFGKNVLIAWNTLLLDSDLHQIYSNNKLINQDKEIRIGDHVWIGCNSTILKGVSISNDSIISAGSTVTKSVTEDHVVIGNRGVLKDNITWNY